MTKRKLNKYFSVIIGLRMSLMLTAGFGLSGCNGKETKDNTQCAVMCLGESFTQRQYPSVLQQILDSKYPGKFSITDCGRSGVHFTDILKSLDDNIKRYRPDIVVFLMGGITVIRQTDENPGNVSEDDPALKNKLSQTLSRADEYQRKGEYEASAQILREFLRQYPDNETAFAYLTEIYFYDLPEFKDTGYEMALKSLKDGRPFERGSLYQKVIVYNKEKNDIPLAKRFTAELLNEENTKIDMVLYGTIKNLLTSEQKEKIFNKLSKEKNDIFYGVAAIDSIERGNFEKAEELFNIAEKIRTDSQDERQNALYRSIVKKLVDYNIKVICMQYPLRSIKPLQNILKNEPYYGKIIFVSNEENFKQALREKKYGEIFRDQYGGDFGHCTDYGNALIAKNLAQTLEKPADKND